jgi:hypothetical protein
MSVERNTGRVPIYWWDVVPPAGTVTVTVNSVAEALTLPTTVQEGFGADTAIGPLPGDPAVTEAYPVLAGTPLSALAALIATHSEVSSVAAYYTHVVGTGWPTGVLEITGPTDGTVAIQFSTAASGRHYGFNAIFAKTQDVADAAGDRAYVYLTDHAGYWSPRTGEGLNLYDVSQSSRYALAQYGDSASSAEWGDPFRDLTATHQEVALARLFLAYRLDPQYAGPAQTVTTNRNNLLEHLLDAARRLTPIKMRRHSIAGINNPPQPAALRLATQGQGASTDGLIQSATAGVTADVSRLRWRWTSYPEG